MAKRKAKKTYTEKIKSIIDEVNNDYATADLAGKLQSIMMNNQLDKHTFNKFKEDFEKINAILIEYEKHHKENTTYSKCEREVTDFLDKIKFLKNQFEGERSNNEVLSISEPNIKIKENNDLDTDKKAESTNNKRERKPNPYRGTVNKDSNTEDVLHNLAMGIEKSKNDVLNALVPLKNSKNLEPIIDRGFKDVKSEIVKNAKELSDKGISLQLKVENRIKTIEEGIETIEPNIKKISKKMEELSEKIDSSASATAQKLTTLPKDERSIIELTDFMKDGLAELENIARYYIQNQAKIERSEADSNDIKEENDRVENMKYEQGKKDATVELAQKIFVQHPTLFEKISSIFEEHIKKKYSVGDEVEVTVDDRQDLELEIEGITEEGSYIIETPAVLLNGEVMKRATAKKNAVKE